MMRLVLGIGASGNQADALREAIIRGTEGT